MPTWIEICNSLLLKKYLRLSDLYKSEFSDEFRLISQEISNNNARQILYHALLGSNQKPLCTCGKPRAWHQDLREYRPFCSGKCATKALAILQQKKYLDNFGVTHHSKLPEFKEKVRTTSLKKFGVEHYSQTSDFLDRTKQTCLNKFGVEHPAQNTKIARKIQKTNLEKYNSNSPLGNTTVRDKSKKTNITKYQTEFPTQNVIIQEKTKQTCLEKFGVTNPAQSATIKEKSIQTRRKNHYPLETLLLIDDLNWLQTQNKNGKSVGAIAQSLGVDPSNLHKKFHKNKLTIYKHQKSCLEQQLLDYYTQKNITVESRNTTCIGPKEIDLLFPSHQLGIEINGAYWHSEEFNKDRFYHLNKKQLANQAGIQLLHFWDWEIINQWDKVIDKINSKLGLNSRVYARKLKAVILEQQSKHEFVSKYHMQNDCPSSINIGLADQHNQLLMVASFGKSRFNKSYQWELLRLCSMHGITIVGGASKLIKHFVDKYMQVDEKLISYCNKQFNTGEVYLKTGFQPLSDTPPGYCYVKAGKYAGSRNQWQKHSLRQKLSIFNPKLTERENMQLNGYYRLWDCGQQVFELIKHKKI